MVVKKKVVVKNKTNKGYMVKLTPKKGIDKNIYPITILNPLKKHIIWDKPRALKEAKFFAKGFKFGTKIGIEDVYDYKIIKAK